MWIVKLWGITVVMYGRELVGLYDPLCGGSIHDMDIGLSINVFRFRALQEVGEEVICPKCGSWSEDAVICCKEKKWNTK